MKRFVRAYMGAAFLVFIGIGCSKNTVLESEKSDWISINSDVALVQMQQTEQFKAEGEEAANDFVRDDGSFFDTLFVSNLSGATITLEPSPESFALAKVPFNSPLKVLEIANCEWVKVYVPRYLRADGKDEGFVKAAFLSHLQNPLKELPDGWRAANLRAFLQSCQWKKRDELSFLVFSPDGTFVRHTAGGENRTEGSWRTVAKDKIEMKTEAETKTHAVTIIGISDVRIGEEVFESKFSLESLESDILDTPLAYATDKNGYTLLEYVSLVSDDTHFASALISAGVNPGISPYRERYDEFWSEKQDFSSEILPEWSDLPDLWAHDFRYLFASADIDADGTSEGLYEHNGTFALIKSAEQKAAILDFSESADIPSAENAVFELFMPYNLVHRTAIFRITTAESDSLFALSEKNTVQKICSLPPVKQDSGEARKIFFSENGIFVIDFSTTYGCISSDSVRIFTQDKTDFARFSDISQ